MDVHLEDHADEGRGLRIWLQRPALGARNLHLSISKGRGGLPQTLCGGCVSSALKALLCEFELAPRVHHVRLHIVLVVVIGEIVDAVRRNDLGAGVFEGIEDQRLIHQIAARQAGDLHVEHAVVLAGGDVGEQALHLRALGEAVAGDDALAVDLKNVIAAPLRQGEKRPLVPGEGFALAAGFGFKVCAGFAQVDGIRHKGRASFTKRTGP